MRVTHNSSLAFILVLAAPNAIAYYRSCKQFLEGKNTALRFWPIRLLNARISVKSLLCLISVDVLIKSILKLDKGYREQYVACTHLYIWVKRDKVE